MSLKGQLGYHEGQGHVSRVICSATPVSTPFPGARRLSKDHGDLYFETCFQTTKVQYRRLKPRTLYLVFLVMCYLASFSLYLCHVGCRKGFGLLVQQSEVVVPSGMS